MSILSLSRPIEIRDDVFAMYQKYKDRIHLGTLMMLPPSGGDPKFYVYEWLTADSKKVFYVGKGTGRRYKHILSDMDRDRGKEYAELQDAFGIEHRFVAECLTDFEACLYELCLIIQRTDEGEILLQSANNPAILKYWDDILQMRQLCAARIFEPKIYVDAYHKRYWNVQQPEFDHADKSALKKVHLSASFSGDSEKTKLEMDILKNQIELSGGIVYKTLAKSVKTIIEFDCLDYRKYKKYKSMGLNVFHAYDVKKIADLVDLGQRA